MTFTIVQRAASASIWFMLITLLKPCAVSQFLPASPAPSSSPWRPLICFLSLDLPVLGVSYKWNPTLCSLVCLVAFTQHNGSQSCFLLQRGSGLHLFLWPNDIPLCEFSTFYLFIQQLVDIRAVSIFWLLGIMLL